MSDLFPTAPLSSKIVAGKTVVQARSKVGHAKGRHARLAYFFTSRSGQLCGVGSHAADPQAYQIVMK
jgi:hypothetical protein